MSFWVPLIFVRMELKSQLAIGLFNLFLGSSVSHSQNIVRVEAFQFVLVILNEKSYHNQADYASK